MELDTRKAGAVDGDRAKAVGTSPALDVSKPVSGVQLVTLRLILCNECGKQFGDKLPASELSDDQLRDFLTEKAVKQGWVEVKAGGAHGVLCSGRCVRAWLKDNG